MSLVNSLYGNDEEQKKFKITRGTIILIGIISALVIVATIVLISIKNKSKSKYTIEDFNKLEKRMVEEAPIYVSQKNIVLNSEDIKIYLKDMLVDNGGAINPNKIKAAKICDGYVIASKKDSESYVAYIKCGDMYTTNGYVTNDKTTVSSTTLKEKDTTKPDIVLNGESVIRIYVGDNYTDSGAKAIDNVDGDISSKIKVSGNVDTKKAGEYVITYESTDKAGNKNSISRKIIVEQRTTTKTTTTTTQAIKTTKSNTTRRTTTQNRVTTKKVIPNNPPTITLKGDKIVKLNVGQGYNEQGYVATDGFGKDITSSVKVSGNVNITSIGTYYINYSITDSYGLSASVTRIVNVKSNYIKLTGITVSPNTAVLKVGAKKTLTVYFNPTNATNKSVSWSSDNPSVATVSGGVVVAKKRGTAYITVTSSDGVSAKSRITVE